jgi:TonB family protein
VRQDSLSTPFVSSCVIHIAVILLASIMVHNNLRRQDYLPIGLVDLPRTETPTPIRKVETPTEIKKPLPRTPKVEKRKETKPVVKNEITKLERSAPPPAAPVKEEPAKAVETKSTTPTRTETAPSPASGARVEGGGSEAGAGNLFGRGEFGVVAGSGVEGGGGGKGGGGIGSGEASAGLARPLGGYQVRPRYPESARRVGAHGTTVLKLQVLENGKVGELVIEQSAGNRDLDNAAADAVRKWLFEPARVGKQPVAVWVLVPVKFELK